jgi:ParB-like chromosome segregation protein Spo0J
MHHPSIEMLPPAQLKPYPRNARTHSKKQIRQIARSIERFGFTNPVLIDENDEIIAGHGRVAAAVQIGLARVPGAAHRPSLSDRQARLYPCR